MRQIKSPLLLVITALLLLGNLSGCSSGDDNLSSTTGTVKVQTLRN